MLFLQLWASNPTGWARAYFSFGPGRFVVVKVRAGSLQWICFTWTGESRWNGFSRELRARDYWEMAAPFCASLFWVMMERSKQLAADPRGIPEANMRPNANAECTRPRCYLKCSPYLHHASRPFSFRERPYAERRADGTDVFFNWVPGHCSRRLACSCAFAITLQTGADIRPGDRTKLKHSLPHLWLRWQNFLHTVLIRLLGL